MLRSLIRSSVRPVVRSVLGEGGSSPAAQAAAIALAASGALYDPSDLTSLYQSRTGGSTGASGSPVGIMLDKSYMGGRTAVVYIAGQAEVSKGAWTQVTATATIAGEDVSLSGGAGFAAAGRQVTVSTGRWCIATINVTAITGTCSFEFRNSDTPGGGSRLVAQPFTTTGVKTILFIGNASGNNIEVRGDGVGATTSFTSLSVKEIPGFHALAPSDAARPLLTVAGSLAYLTADGVDDWMNVTPVLNLGEAWWHVGGWKVDGVAAFGYLFAAVNSYRSAAYYTAAAGDAYSMRNAADTANLALVSGTETTTNVFSLTQTSSTAATGWINAGGSTGSQAIFNASALLKGLALFSNNNTTFGQGLAGRFYGGPFCPGALTTADRAIVDRYVAGLSGVTL